MNDSNVHEHLTALADPLRCRILLLLERQEVTVGELCSILQLPQSTVSRHLKTLADAGWVVSRRDGTSRYYSWPDQRMDSITPQLWDVVRDEVRPTPAAKQDIQRLESVLATRRRKSQAFFASAAGQWDRMRTELFGRNFCSSTLLSLMDERWVVGDLGCGTGEVATLLGPHVERVIAVDASPEMLEAAHERLRSNDNVIIRQGVLEELPVDDASLDVALFMLVLHHLPDPAAALSEAVRVLRPGGKLLIVDMYAHEREEYKHQMGHVWLGFPEEKIKKHLEAAGLRTASIHPIPPEPDAKGPALFAAVARRPVLEVARSIHGHLAGVARETA